MWPFKYPYTNFHELNLDWIVEKVKDLEETVKNFIAKYKPPVPGLSDIDWVNVVAYGADPSGEIDSTLAINAAVSAAEGRAVYFPTGSYAANGEINSAFFICAPNVTINGSTPGVFLQGGCLSIGKPFEIGNPKWLELIRQFSTSISRFSVTSDNGKIAGVFGSKSSDTNIPGDMGTIGVESIGINDNTQVFNSAWGMYAEGRRKGGKGNAYGMEIDVEDTAGDCAEITPDGAIPTDGKGIVCNINLSSGQGNANNAGKNASAAVIIHKNPGGFKHGIVFLDGAVSGNAIFLPSRSKIAWVNGAYDNDSKCVRRMATEKALDAPTIELTKSGGPESGSLIGRIEVKSGDTVMGGLNFFKDATDTCSVRIFSVKDGVERDTIFDGNSINMMGENGSRYIIRINSAGQIVADPV